MIIPWHLFLSPLHGNMFAYLLSLSKHDAWLDQSTDPTGTQRLHSKYLLNGCHSHNADHGTKMTSSTPPDPTPLNVPPLPPSGSLVFTAY